MPRRPGLPEHSTIDAHIGSRLRLRRALLGLSQEKLATMLGITFQQVQKYERGTNRISGSRLYDLALALDTPVSFFFDGIPSGPGTAAASPPRPTTRSSHRPCAARRWKSCAPITRVPVAARQSIYQLLKSMARSAAGVVAKNGYCLYFLNAEQGIEAAHPLEAEDDATALWIAERLYQACSDVCASFELRQGARDVGGAPLAETGEAAVTLRQEMLVRHEEALRDSSVRIARSRELLKALERANGHTAAQARQSGA
jgi:transcriptional regulator with XRE-family HTH domain